MKNKTVEAILPLANTNVKEARTIFEGENPDYKVEKVRLRTATSKDRQLLGDDHLRAVWSASLTKKAYDDDFDDTSWEDDLNGMDDFTMEDPLPTDDEGDEPEEDDLASRVEALEDRISDLEKLLDDSPEEVEELETPEDDDTPDEETPEDDDEFIFASAPKQEGVTKKDAARDASMLPKTAKAFKDYRFAGIKEEEDRFVARFAKA